MQNARRAPRLPMERRKSASCAGWGCSLARSTFDMAQRCLKIVVLSSEPDCFRTFSCSTKVQGFVEGLTEGAHFDKDAQGFRRMVAHGDEWMHSRLMHEGVEQRVRVAVCCAGVLTVVLAKR